MCNGRSFPEWQANAIRSIVDVPGATIEMLIVRAARDPRRRRIGRVVTDWRHLIWNLYNKLVVERRSRASRSVDLSSLLGDATIIECEPVRIGRFGEGLAGEDLAKVRSADLDFILRFGFGILKGAVLEAARYGIWSFHHGDERQYRGQPPAFWEIVDGSPSVGAILQRLTDRLDAGIVLHRGSFRATAHSYRRTRDEVLLGSSDFAAIAVRQLILGQTELVTDEPSSTTAAVRRSPGNLTMLRFFVKQAVRFARSQWTGVVNTSQWTVGVGNLPISSVLSEDLGEIDWVDERPGGYLADPFPDPTGRTSIVLVEDYDFALHRGVISALDPIGDRSLRAVLDAGVHASYPFLFEHHGEIYCTPETYEAGEVRLYRAVDWPDEWELVATLIEGREVLDPTIVHHGGRWWLFCTLAGPYSNTKLHVFHADSLHSEWAPHPLNPVKTSVVGSRPAGTPFLHDGVLHRPGQDSSVSYGGGIVVHRIDALTPERFEEVEVARVRPPGRQRYATGLHTVSSFGERMVVDGRRDTFSLVASRREVGARLRRLRLWS